MGVKAAEVGYSIRFLTLETMMTRLVKAKHENRLERALQQLAYPRLLIIVPGSPAALPPGAVGS